MWLGTLESPHEAMHAYDAATWRFGHSADMNFFEIESREVVEMLAPPLTLNTAEEKRGHNRQQ
jgi:hypothetical protein